MNLYLGGRLFSLSLFCHMFMSMLFPFSKASLGIIFSIDYILYHFLGGCKDHMKISWVDWDYICLKRRSEVYG